MSDPIHDFVSITGATAEQARFYLDAAGGDYQQAVSNFYEPGATDSGAASEAPAEPAYTGPRTLSGEPARNDSFSSVSSQASARRPFTSSNGPRLSTFRDLASGNSSASNSTSSFKKPPRNTGPRIGRVQHGGDDHDDEDDRKDPSEFFAGGEKSGLAVTNPNDRQTPSIIRGILEKAEHPTLTHDIELEGSRQKSEEGETTQPARSAFTGQGHSLSDPKPTATSAWTPPAFEHSSEMRRGIPPDSIFNQAPVTRSDVDNNQETALRTLTFWRNGFSVDAGRLYRYDDPANEKTLELINSGHAPVSVLNVKYGQPVELRVTKRLDEDWVAPPAAPFGGEGHRLGAELGPFAAAVSSPAATPAVTPASAAPNASFEVDSSSPTTSIQIRLADGSRMVAKFNHTHTVGDIRRYIINAHPGSNPNFVLQTTFPTSELKDDTQTIKDANLLGSVVVQKVL